MTKTIKTVITFVITLTLFATMSANAFAYTLTDAEAREIAAMTPEQRGAKCAEIKAQRGGSLSVEDINKINEYAHEIKLANYAKQEAQNEQYGLTIETDYEWALPELSKALDAGLMPGLNRMTREYSPNHIASARSITLDIAQAFYCKGYWSESDRTRKLTVDNMNRGNFAHSDMQQLYVRGIITHNSPGVELVQYVVDVNVIGDYYDILNASTATCTRQDFAVMLARAAKSVGLTDNGPVITFNDTDKFTDGSDYTAEEAKAAAQFMVNRGIMWFEDGNFNPDRNTTSFDSKLCVYRLYVAIPQYEA